jgi:diacylglycerol kinase (ATP)
MDTAAQRSELRTPLGAQGSHLTAPQDKDFAPRGARKRHNAPVPAPPVLILLNPVAANGRAARAAHRVAALAGDDAILVIGHSADHLTELAASAGDEGYRRVIAAGGDGTVQAIVNGLMRADASRAELGIVPVGSGNDLARSLGLPRSLPLAVRVALDAAASPMDLGRAHANGAARWFGSAAGVGFDAQVATAMALRRRAWQRGRTGYLATTLVELRRTRNHHVRLTTHGDDGSVNARELTLLFAVVANGAFYGGGMRIAPDATVHDGRLDLIEVADISRRTALRQLPNLYRGTHLRHPAVSASRVTAVQIEPLEERPLPLHLDGEPWQAAPVRFELHPAALRVAHGGHHESASLRA